MWPATATTTPAEELLCHTVRVDDDRTPKQNIREHAGTGGRLGMDNISIKFVSQQMTGGRLPNVHECAKR